MIGVAVLPAILVAAFAPGRRVGASPTPSPLLPQANVISVYGGTHMLMQIKVPTDRGPDRVALRLALTARLTQRDCCSRSHMRCAARACSDVARAPQPAGRS